MRNRCRAGILALVLQFLLPAAAAAAVPTVNIFSPMQGKPGTQVVINGSGFLAATLVTFDTTPADFIASSDTRMTATVPLDATPGPIRVTNPTGTGASSATFVVAPRITGFSPHRGATNTVVLLEGFNFIGTTNVLFNDAQAAFSVTAQNGIQIRATVPTGATNGPITVRT